MIKLSRDNPIHSDGWAGQNGGTSKKAADTVIVWGFSPNVVDSVLWVVIHDWPKRLAAPQD